MLRLMKQLFAHPSVVDPLYERLTGKEADYLTDDDRTQGLIGVMRTYEPFKLIQRFLALVVILTYVGVWILSVGLFAWAGIASLAGHDTTILVSIADRITTLNRELLEWPALLVLSLYFGGGVAEGILERWKTRPSNK